VKEMGRSQTTSWIANAVLLILCGVVAYSMWSLASQNRQLRAQIEDLRSTSSLRVLRAGDRLPDVPVRILDGQAGRLAELLQRGGVVAFLTTTCPFCEQTRPVWRRLARRAEAAGKSFLALSLDDLGRTRAYATERRVELPLWVLDITDTVGLPIERVPVTVLMDPGGRVHDTWLGPLNDVEAGDLLEALGGSLEAPVSSPSTVGDPDCCVATASGTDAGPR